MERLLCILLALCMLSCCLIACKKDSVPKAVGAKYSVIEGRRIPFRYLFISAVKNCGDHFVLRSTKEVEQAFKKDFLYDEFYDGSSIEDELKEFLMEIDYDKYRVLGVTTTSHKDVTNLVELIERDGELCAVADREIIELKRGVMSGSYFSVIKVRKEDFDLPDCITPFDVPVTLYLGDKNDPSHAELVA